MSQSSFCLAPASCWRVPEASGRGRSLCLWLVEPVRWVCVRGAPPAADPSVDVNGSRPHRARSSSFLSLPPLPVPPQLYEAFTVLKGLGALTLVHAENGDLIAQVSGADSLLSSTSSS